MYPQWILNNRENYEFILKNNSDYSTVDVHWQQNLSCSEVSVSKGLKKLKKEYNLDRLKQKRNDIELCFRAMEWTFQQLLSKIQTEYNGPLNAMEILKYCKKSRTTVNCLCHATVLTEVLLALGFRSRKISCMPIDVVPFDNHVVTVVYVPSLGKWIMLDPSMCCYITDKAKNILSIPEIRRHLINGLEIEICTYGRFNNLNIPNGDHLTFNQTEYVVYLFKNLFRFLSRMIQNSDTTKDNDVFYMLVPKGYIPSNKVQKWFVEDATVELRVTDNEDFFWGI